MPLRRLLWDHFGTSGVPTGSQVSTERGPGQLDGAPVRVEVALGRGERFVPGDLAEDVQGDPGELPGGAGDQGVTRSALLAVRG